MKLLSQLKYCNGAVVSFSERNILLNETELIVLSIYKYRDGE